MILYYMHSYRPFSCTKIMPSSSFKHNPSFLVAVERPSINQNDIYCNMNGDDVSSYVGKIDYMFNEALEKNIPTIGVGDGGNEIGMGNIYKSTTHILPFGNIIASRPRTTSFSGEPRYGIGAYMALLQLYQSTGSQLMHDANFEKNLIETCIKSGALDGISKKSSCSVDGLPSDFHGHIMGEYINYLVMQSISQN